VTGGASGAAPFHSAPFSSSSNSSAPSASLPSSTLTISSKGTRFNESQKVALQRLAEHCNWKFRVGNPEVVRVAQEQGLEVLQIRGWMQNNKPQQFKRAGPAQPKPVPKAGKRGGRRSQQQQADPTSPTDDADADDAMQ
jgi:hypothetical protein